MARRRKKGNPVGKNHGKALTPAQIEGLVQSYAVTNSIRQAAREMRVSEKTARKYINAVPQKEIAEARLNAHKSLAGKIHTKADAIIESITPEDYESGRLPIYDGDGNLTGYRTFGPTLMQKVTAAAILTDKLKVLNEIERTLQEGRDNGELLIPQDIKGLLAGIRGKIKSIGLLHVKFEDENPELSQKIQDTLARAEAIADAVPAEAEVLDFDNPAVEDADYEDVPGTTAP